jgi:hypothetical protein
MVGAIDLSDQQHLALAAWAQLNFGVHAPGVHDHALLPYRINGFETPPR